MHSREISGYFLGIAGRGSSVGRLMGFGSDLLGNGWTGSLN